LITPSHLANSGYIGIGTRRGISNASGGATDLHAETLVCPGKVLGQIVGCAGRHAALQPVESAGRLSGVGSTQADEGSQASADTLAAGPRGLLDVYPSARLGGGLACAPKQQYIVGISVASARRDERVEGLGGTVSRRLVSGDLLLEEPACR